MNNDEFKMDPKEAFPESLVHYTLNTGHTNDSPRKDVGDDIIQLLAPIVRKRESPLPRFDDYQLWTTRTSEAAVFTIVRTSNQEPLIHCALAWTKEGEQGLWPGFKQVYDDAYGIWPNIKAAIMPARLPWLSVILLPGCAFVRPEHMFMMGDLERCVAWTILDNHNRQTAPSYEAKLLPQSGNPLRVEPLNKESFTLPELQKLLGGHIEIVPLPLRPELILVVNEWGKADPQLRVNDLATRLLHEYSKPGSFRSLDRIVGDALLCHTALVP